MDGDYSAQDGIKISIQEPYAFLKRKDEKLTNIVYLKKGQTTGEWEIKLNSDSLRFPITYTME